MEHVINVNYGDDIVKVIFDNLDIRAKTVGIGISDFYGTEETYEFLYTLCTQRHDLKVAIIPGDLNKSNLILLPEDVLGIYLYPGEVSEVVKGYDVWVTIEDGEVTFINNLPDATVTGDKLVVANQMKTVLAQVNPGKVSDQPAEMLFSHKSMIQRTIPNWFVEFPPNAEDTKLLAGGALKYIQDNRDIVISIIEDAKTRINRTTIPMGVMLVYTEYPNIRAAMRDTPKGPYVLIKIGMVNFGFSVQRAMIFDWYKLMVDQLDLLSGV